MHKKSGLEKSYGSPQIVNDGVTIAKEINLDFDGIVIPNSNIKNFFGENYDINTRL